MLCCGENRVTLVHIMKNESVKFIVIVKETFYVCHLPTLMQSFSKIFTCMVNFLHIRISLDYWLEYIIASYYILSLKYTAVCIKLLIY